MTAPTLEAERAALELAPCPFCGGKAELRKTPNMWMVECNNAECGSNPDALAVFKHDAIAAWNRRSAAPVAEDVAPLPLDAEGLPPLPEPYQPAGEDAGCWFPDFFTAEQVRQAQREAVEADRARQVLAWATFADNGNVIIWSRRRDEVEPAAAKYGNPVVPIIAYIDGRTAGTAPDESRHIESEAVSAMLWLYRRLPRCYGRPPNVEQPITALAKLAGVEMNFVAESFAERGAAPSHSPAEDDK